MMKWNRKTFPRTKVAAPVGFTLIELLVVVAIIAVLISILLPALSQARMQARSVVCKNQLSNLGKAFLFYSQDHNGIMPGYNWYYPYGFYKIIAIPYYLDSKWSALSPWLFVCPDIPADVTNNGPPYWGGTYVYNMNWSVKWTSPFGTQKMNETKQLEKATMPDRTAILGDGIQFIMYPSYEFSFGDGYAARHGGQAFGPLVLEGRRVNCLYADIHVDTISYPWNWTELMQVIKP